MEPQEMYDLLVETRDKCAAAYKDHEREIEESNSPAAKEAFKMLLVEREKILAELNRRIEAHPLHQK